MLSVGSQLCTESTPTVIVACTRGAGPRTARYFAIHHTPFYVTFALFPSAACCGGSLASGAKAEWWNDGHRAQSSKRDLSLAQGGWCANGTRPDSTTAQRRCSYCKRFGQVGGSAVTRRLGTTQGRGYDRPQQSERGRTCPFPGLV